MAAAAILKIWEIGIVSWLHTLHLQMVPNHVFVSFKIMKTGHVCISLLLYQYSLMSKGLSLPLFLIFLYLKYKEWFFAIMFLTKQAPFYFFVSFFCAKYWKMYHLKTYLVTLIWPLILRSWVFLQQLVLPSHIAVSYWEIKKAIFWHTTRILGFGRPRILSCEGNHVYYTNLSWIHIEHKRLRLSSFIGCST